MKPLNRPMFRYGGPIKEGVMSGIQERVPYKTGGGYLKNLGGAIANFYNPLKKLRPIQKIKKIYSGDPSRYGVPAAEGLKQKTIRFLKPDEKAGVLTNKYLFDRTLVPAAGAVKYGVQKALPYATAGGLTIGGGTALYNALKGDPKIDDDGISQENKIKAAIGMPENLTIRKDPKTAQIIADKLNQDATKSAEELRKDRVQRYRDIMDIKGMNKTAAYNSLIAASQLINQEGDFKGSIKDGSLISKLIGATSKAFDKPSQTKDAIDTLILKGEIEKDIKASDPSNAVLNELRAGQLKKLNKDLKGNTTAEIIQARMLKDDMPSGSNLAGLISINNPELNVKVLPTKDLGNADPIDYMTKIVTTVNADETTPDYPAGVYVLKDKVIQITEEGAVVPVPINALK